MTDQTYSVGTWQLNELYSSFDDSSIDSSLEDLEASLNEFEAYRDQLEKDLDTETFQQILKDYEAMDRLESRLSGYAMLRFSEDTQNQRAQTFQAKIQQRSAEIRNRTLFFRLWWKGLEEERAQKLLETAGDYRYWLEALRLQSPYTLSESEEKIINIKDVNGASALMTLYSSITNRYSFELEVKGEKLELTRGELAKYVWGSDPALRKAAYEELHGVYGEDSPILGQIYQFRVRDWHSEHVELRGYSSPIAVRNLSNDIPDEVVDTLLEVSRQNASLFQDFFKLKADWLGMDRLRRYDLYAPVAEADKDYEYDEAVQLVLDSYGRFDPEVAELAGRVLAEGHVDSEVRKGKRSGAFCATISPDLTPYI
ncbi:MAG: M3 family metallopeptidase, partial [Anaerolineales bacterium]